MATKKKCKHLILTQSGKTKKQKEPPIAKLIQDWIKRMLGISFNTSPIQKIHKAEKKSYTLQEQNAADAEVLTVIYRNKKIKKKVEKKKRTKHSSKIGPRKYKNSYGTNDIMKAIKGKSPRITMKLNKKPFRVHLKQEGSNQVVVANSSHEQKTEEKNEITGEPSNNNCSNFERKGVLVQNQEKSGSTGGSPPTNKESKILDKESSLESIIAKISNIGDSPIAANDLLCIRKGLREILEDIVKEEDEFWVKLKAREHQTQIVHKETKNKQTENCKQENRDIPKTNAASPKQPTVVMCYTNFENTTPGLLKENRKKTFPNKSHSKSLPMLTSFGEMFRNNNEISPEIRDVEKETLSNRAALQENLGGKLNRLGVNQGCIVSTANENPTLDSEEKNLQLILEQSIEKSTHGREITLDTGVILCEAEKPLSQTDEIENGNFSTLTDVNLLEVSISTTSTCGTSKNRISPQSSKTAIKSFWDTENSNKSKISSTSTSHTELGKRKNVLKLGEELGMTLINAGKQTLRKIKKITKKKRSNKEVADFLGDGSLFQSKTEKNLSTRQCKQTNTQQKCPKPFKEVL